eukprot:1655187-Pyramimonas_sp.AAC.1
MLKPPMAINARRLGVAMIPSNSILPSAGNKQFEYGSDIIVVNIHDQHRVMAISGIDAQCRNPPRN